MSLNEDSRAENIRLISDSAAFVASSDRLAKVRQGRFALPGFDRADWEASAALGWLGLRVGEDQGGIGFGVQEYCALAEQLGTGLVAAPLVQAIAIAPLLPDDWRARLLDGSAVVVPAWQEARGISAATATVRLSDGTLTGEKQYVPMAAGADAFLVTADQGLAIVERGTAGVIVDTDLLQDGGHYGTLRLTNAPAIAVPGDFADVREELTLAVAAYLLGTMRRAFAITSDYLSTRQQFGKPIGSFQSLQHRMVDLYIQIELSRASIYKAAVALETEADMAARMLAVSRAKARASDAAMLVTRQGVQLHGGIGYTDACDVGLFLRKAMALANYHGSAAQHRARFVDLAAKGDKL